MEEEKISVGILGATGEVGQRLVLLLEKHPFFKVTSLVASDRSTKKKYREAALWRQKEPMPEHIGRMLVSALQDNLPCQVLFSALDAEVAFEAEENFREKGYHVISNARSHRFDSDVPLLIPEVNPDHLEILNTSTKPGFLIANPNCVVAGLALALKPLNDAFFLEEVHVVTMQALSLTGQMGQKNGDIDDNLIPFIAGEEEKIETEPKKILGKLEKGKIIPWEVKISAQANRVPITEGHTACISIKMKKKVEKEDLIDAWLNFKAESSAFLPTSPIRPIHYLDHISYPQPKLHREVERGMAVVTGRLRPCSVFDFRFVILSHNMIRGAAGALVLNAELMYRRGYLHAPKKQNCH